MKKALTLLVILTLLASVLCVPLQSSAEGVKYPLINDDDHWDDFPNGGVSVELGKDGNGNYVFSGSIGGTWPATQCVYADPITVDVAKTSLKYDFDVDAGNTNITFLFGNFNFPLSNSALGDVNYEAGSGDLMSATYKGTMKLTDLIESVKNYDSSPFDKSLVVDGKLTFTGILVYSVSGGVITVRKLELVEEDGGDTDDPDSEEPSADVSVEPSEEPSADASADASVEPSEAVSAEEPAESASKPDESKPASVSPAESGAPEQSDPVRILGLELWAFVLVVLAAIAVIAVIVYVIFGRKKK